MRSLLVLALLGLLACGASREVEPYEATPSEEPVAAGDDSPLANDFVRTELRAIHDRCDAYVATLERDVDEAATREDVATAAAAVAYVVGEIADGSGDAEVMGRTGADARSCIETPDAPGCGVTPVPSTAAGRESPLHRDTVDARLTATDRIRAVNQALDALDDFVFSRPDPARWTPEDEATWTRRKDTASRECGSAPPPANDASSAD
jgi:hypothetical protein